MCLQEELRLLKLLSEQLKRAHRSFATEITYSLSDSTLHKHENDDKRDEEKGLYHALISFCDLKGIILANNEEHYNLDYVYIKIGKRFRHGNLEVKPVTADKFVPYYGFLRMTVFEEYDGQLLGRCSDDYAYELPLDTLLYIEHRRLYEDLDQTIKLLQAQLRQA